MNKGIFLVLVMMAGVGFISGCQQKAAEEQTMEISAPVEGAVSAPAEAPAQIQIAQPQNRFSSPRFRFPRLQQLLKLLWKRKRR